MMEDDIGFDFARHCTACYYLVGYNWLLCTKCGEVNRDYREPITITLAQAVIVLLSAVFTGMFLGWALVAYLFFG